MTKLFGTDGMRGEAGKFPLDVATVRNVGASLGKHLSKRLGRSPRIVIGRDTRESGPWLEDAFIQGATDVGARAESAGIITTPGVAYLARALPADAGVVISASHNEYKDNGLKVFAPSGRKLDEATENLIEADIRTAQQDSEPNVSVLSTSAEPLRSNSEFTDKYFQFLIDDIGKGIELKGLKLLVDCANGASSNIAPQVLRHLGAGVEVINNTPDGRNINLDSGSLHPEKLQRLVKERGANLGVAYDGDADRALFVNDLGEMVNGDACLWILANYLKEQGDLAQNVVVATVMSNIGLELAFRAQKIELVRTDVGDKFVLEELLKLKASLGGEQSGHIIFPKLSLAGDGIITTLYLLKAVTEKQKTVRELSKGLETYPQILVNIKVARKVPFEELPEVQRAARDIEGELGDKGRLLLRYSGTESLARVMLEGESDERIKTLAHELASVIAKSIGD